MNLGWFDVPTTIHEFGHVLGMIHEHQNPYGQTIKWDEKKVLEWAKETQGWSEQTTRDNIINKYDKNSINGSSFDPLSIMLYFFPASLTLNNIGTKQNFRLSEQDVLWIDKIYHNDNGISPETFYKNTYGVLLKSSIDKNNNLSLKFGNKKSSTWKKILAIMVIIIFFIGIIVLFLHLRRLQS
jgi:ATP-dependent Zn protease